MAESPVAAVEHLPQAVVVHVPDRELRKDEVDALCNEVDKARVVAATLPFILDMARVNFANSLALGVLVGLNQEFRTRGQPLIFVGFQPQMRQALELVRFNRIMEIQQDVPTALRNVRTGS
jgi:anti-anti-sigma factor